MRSKIIGFIEHLYPLLFLTLCFSVTFIKPAAILSYRLLFAAFILQLLLGAKLQRLKSWHTFSVLLYFSVIALSLAYTQDTHFGNKWLRIACICFIILVFVEKLPGKALAQRLIHAFIGGGTILSLIMVYQGIIEHSVRPAHVFHPVHAGNLLLFSLVATVSLMLAATSQLNRLLYTSIASLQLYALYLNGTRGAWIAFAVIIVVLPFSLLKLPPMWKAGYVVSLVLAGTLLVQGKQFQVKFHEALSDINLYQSGVASNSLGGRFVMWKASCKMFMDNPILGVGIGDWVDEYQKEIKGSKAEAYLMEFNQPHNIYLAALSTRGLVGLFSLLIFILYPLVFVWKRRDPETDLFRNLVIMTVVAMLIAGMTETITIIRYVFMAYCAMIGIGMSVFVDSDSRSQSLPSL